MKLFASRFDERAVLRGYTGYGGRGYAAAIYLVLEISIEISEAVDRSRRPLSRGFIS